MNPCATITALAERSCDKIIRDRNWSVDERPNETLNLEARPFRSLPLSLDLEIRNEQLRLNDATDGLKFDETLQGFLLITTDDCGFETAASIAQTASSSAQLSITVRLQRSNNGLYKGFTTGTLSYGALSQDPLLITRGSIDFFAVDLGASDAVNLTYNLKLLGTDGKAYVMHGYKTIDSSIAFSMSRTWTATTTLCTTITRTDGTPVAKGVLRLSLRNFLAEVWSIRCSRTVSLTRQIDAKVQFLKFFTSNILSYMFSPLRPLQYQSPEDFKPGESKKPRPTETWIQSVDNVHICVKKWDPPPQVIPKKTPIVLIPGASVDDQIFSLPSIPTNAIDYFTERGYRCYVPILRFGFGKEAKNGWTVFDARLDVRAALVYVRNQEKNQKVYAIVHCLGSIATATALLHGDIEACWFSGMTCSQVFTNLIYSKDNDFKARNQILIKAYRVS